MPEITINRAESLPIHLQLIEQLKFHIESGTWAPGARLPTVREQAERLGLNYNTIRAAYTELERQGYVITERGRGTFVVDSPPRLSSQQPDSVLDLIDDALAAAQALGVSTDELARIAYMRAKLLPVPPANVRLLFVECNSADLNYYAETIKVATGVSPSACLFDDLRQHSASYIDRFDLIATPLFHLEELQQLVGSEHSVLGLMVEPSYETVIEPLTHLPPHSHVGLICATHESAQTMQLMLLGLGLKQLHPLIAGVNEPDKIAQVFKEAETVFVSRHGALDQQQPWPQPERVRLFAEELNPRGLRLLRRHIAAIKGAPSTIPASHTMNMRWSPPDRRR